MARKLSTMDLRKQLGDILNRVALRQDEYVIERKGRPLAALVPVERLLQMRQAARLHLLDVLSRQRPALSQKETDRLADDAKHAVRRSPSGRGAKPRSKRSRK